jgi:hypothetical protein
MGTMAVRLDEKKERVRKGSFQKECLVLQPRILCCHAGLELMR